MSRTRDIVLTAIAPVIWGSTYIVTIELLPQGYPLTVSVLRALPAGLLLLLIVRHLPWGIWWLRAAVLGALNIAIFLPLLFVAAYRLPGGVAATVGAIQPLIVIGLAALVLGSAVRGVSVLAALLGIGGVALLILTPEAALDPVGIAAGLAGAFSMAAGVVLTRKWQPPVSLLTFTAWQLTAGGVLLVPVTLLLEPPLPELTGANVAGFIYLGLIGAALTYALWFRGLARIEPSVAAALGLLSPVMAVILGWVILGQNLSPTQFIGALVVLGSVWLSQYAGRQPVPAGVPVK